MVKKILFIASHRPCRNPGQRFRFEQYLDKLRQEGYQCELSYIISEQDDAVFYAPGMLFRKLLMGLKAFFHRLRDVRRARQYDIVFVFREAFFIGSAFFEKRFASSGAKVVFDFDDAIWHFDVSEGNRSLGWLKRPSKTAEIIGISDAVIAGNRYLADYALKFNSQVQIIPTTIDTAYHKPVSERNWNPEVVCIGWTGSHTTVKHFRIIEPVLLKLRQKYGDRIRFKLIGDASYSREDLGLRGMAWKLDSEVSDLADIDIGIMPLPDDEWAKGKCGFKGLQYMAMEIPAVMSPVGVNTEIISHGVNGFLAETEREWEEVLSSLIESHELRRRIGIEARKVIEARFSVNAHWPAYRDLFRGLVPRD
ncbi:MAG: glycosyltransferase family 4 protein [Sphingobacteriales bacterium]|jgi:glycosyltransferase involved in cell wall biosynthesis|nr:glycosyltransferase family 4 protein [Sphingobacteriales bacterium]